VTFNKDLVLHQLLTTFIIHP